MKRIFTPIVLLLAFSMKFANAQSVTKFVQPDLLETGFSNAQNLFKGYLTPWGNMFGAALNGGWYNTAKPHKLGGFDITFSANIAFAPPSASAFSLTPYVLSNVPTNVTASSPSSCLVFSPTNTITNSPTISGSTGTQVPVIDYYIKSPDNSQYYKVSSITMPSGAGLNFFPLPMAQIGLGLFKGTEIIGRYLPTVSMSGIGSIGLWGVGIKHSLFQYLPAQKLIPIDISILGGYTKLSSSADINFPLSEGGYSGLISDKTTQTFNYSGQSMNLNTSAFTASLLISTTFPIINIYGGVGYSNTETQMLLKGDYAFPTVNSSGQLVLTNSNVVQNPSGITIKNNSGIRYSIGLRLKMAIITIHADYTKDLYSVVAAGIGFSFR